LPQKKQLCRCGSAGASRRMESFGSEPGHVVMDENAPAFAGAFLFARAPRVAMIPATLEEAMPYVRLSIAKPRKGEEQRLEDVMRKLATVTEGYEGFVESYVLRPHDDSGEIARITIYRDEASAERAANNQSVMALRSEMHLIAEPGHVERAFFSI
jgi:quinol monooxygenase YgiN